MSFCQFCLPLSYFTCLFFSYLTLPVSHCSSVFLSLSSPHPGNLAHFPSLREAGIIKEKVLKYHAVLCKLIHEFESRFEDLRHNGTDFNATILLTVCSTIHHQCGHSQCWSSDGTNKASVWFRTQKQVQVPSLADFYKCVSANRYPKMCKQAQIMLSLFGSTYLFNKCKLRSCSMKWYVCMYVFVIV